MNTSQIFMLAVALLLVAGVVIAFQMLRLGKRLLGLVDPPMPAFPPSGLAEPRADVAARRGVLPMSSISGHGRVPEIYVYDEAESTFRRVGLVDANGKIDLKDPYGDGLRLLKGKLYRIVGRPQCVALRPERITIAEGSTPGGAADWNVHDIKVGNRSQLAQAGVLPGDILKSSAIDSFVSFETIQTAMDFSLDVSYVGPNESEPFTCAVVGTEASYSYGN